MDKKSNDKNNIIIKKTIVEKKIKYIINQFQNELSTDKLRISVVNTIDYIVNNFKGYDFLTSFDLLLAKVTEASKDNKDYFDLIVKEIYNNYYKLITDDFFVLWSIILYKTLYNKYNINYTTIFGYYFYIFVYNNMIELSIGDLEFPLKENISLFEIVDKFDQKMLTIKSFNKYSPSHNLFFEEILGDKLFFFLVKFFEKHKNINLWFPYAGIGIEPLYFAYLFDIFKQNKNIDGNFNIYCSSPNITLLRKGLILPQIKSRVEEQKNAFIKRYKLNKNNKNITKIKKRIFIQQMGDFKNSKAMTKINFVLLSIKLTDNDLQQKILALLNEFNYINKEYFVIIEVESSFKLEIVKKKYEDFIFIDIIFSEFIGQLNDKHITYLLFKKSEKGQNNLTKTLIDNSIELLYQRCKSMTDGQIKKELNKIKYENLKERDALLFASLLSKTGKFSKSFDLIKINFMSDYTLSNNILNKILQKCKNKKLINQIYLFIEKNHLKEQSFSAELLSVVVDEIDKYFFEHPKSNLNKKKWL